MSQESEYVIGDGVVTETTASAAVAETTVTPAPAGASLSETRNGTTLTASITDDGDVSVRIEQDGHTVHHFDLDSPPRTRGEVA